MTVLTITNGDSAADLLRAAGCVDPVMPWRDPLHEGPIVAGSLRACSAARVPFLAARFGIDQQLVAAEFAERDDLLTRHHEFDRIELWFEHDLYDQLQLVQILHLLDSVERSEGVNLVQTDEFLGHQRASTILRFGRFSRVLTAADLEIGSICWQGLAAPDPTRTHEVTNQAAKSRHPYLMPALRRFLRELPAPGTGLSLTERRILDAVSDRPTKAGALFAQVLASEEAAYMGDLSFFCVVEDLATCTEPLVTGLTLGWRSDPDHQQIGSAEIAITDTGRRVLAGQADHVAINGLDRWWGGTHLLGSDTWRYDVAPDRLVAPEREAPHDQQDNS